jgi:fission process protein 1
MSTQDYDIFKDSLLRYCGYANELGEAFRPIVHVSAVRFSYLIELLYFFSDTFHKGAKAYQKEDYNKTKEAIKAGTYTLVWQCLASVVIPAFVINRSVKLTGYLVNKTGIRNKYIPTLIGLSMIPILPYSLDPAVDKFMSKTLGPGY